jgi:ribosome-binding protein aMBF1 (putative translation factor)
MEERDGAMKMDERAMFREKLDKEQRHMQAQGRREFLSPHWLRRVRQALGVSMEEMAEELQMNRSAIFRMEESEAARTISLKSLDKLAATMGCKVVYAIVPHQGRTLTQQAEWRRWTKQVLKG